MTRDTIDRVFLLDANALGYWRGTSVRMCTATSGATCTTCCASIRATAATTWRTRRASLSATRRACRRSTEDEVLVAHLSRTDAYPAALFPRCMPPTRSYAQFLWNRLNAEKSVPPDERRLWWQTTLALAAKLMDERAGNIPQLALEGRVELAIMAALDDAWRDHIVDPATERRKGRTYDYEHKSLVDCPFVPALAAPQTTANLVLWRALTAMKRVDEKKSGGGGVRGHDIGGLSRQPHRQPTIMTPFVEALIGNYEAVVATRGARPRHSEEDEAEVRRIMWPPEGYKPHFSTMRSPSCWSPTRRREPRGEADTQ